MHGTMKFVLLATSFVVPTAALGAAQSGEAITISSSQGPLFIEGELQGCALNFEAGRLDPEYNDAKMAYISGSVNFYAFPEKMPFYVLKIGIKHQPDGQFIPPEDAYLITGYKTNASDFVDRQLSDTLGFALFRYSSDDLTTDAAMGNVAETGKLRLGYALRKGGMAAIVSIDLTMKELNLQSPTDSLRDTTTAYRWIECQGEALNSAYGAMDESSKVASEAADAALEAIDVDAQ